MEWLIVIAAGLWVWLILNVNKKKRGSPPPAHGDTSSIRSAISTAPHPINKRNVTVIQTAAIPLDAWKSVPIPLCTGITSQWRDCNHARAFFIDLAGKKAGATRAFCEKQNYHLAPAGDALAYVQQFKNEGLLEDADMALLLELNYRVDDLKAELKALSLIVSGRHPDLAQRLAEQAPIRAQQMTEGREGYRLTAAGRKLAPQIESIQERWSHDISHQRAEKDRELKLHNWARDLREYRNDGFYVGINVALARDEDCEHCVQLVGNYRLQGLSEWSPPSCNNPDGPCMLYWHAIPEDDAKGLRWKAPWPQNAGQP